MLITIALFCLLLGYLLAFSRRPKKPAIEQKIIPPQNTNLFNPPEKQPYLEDKMWYESELDFLFKFNERLISAVGLEEVIQSITEAAHDFLPIERTIFLTWNKEQEKFKLACSRGWQPDSNEPLNIGKESISGLVLHNRDKLVVTDLSQESYLNKLKKEEFLQKMFISVPLMYKNEALGVLHVCEKKTPGMFTTREISAVMNIIRMGSIGLENALLFEEQIKKAEELRLAYNELKEMQDKLIQSEKLKAIGELASGVAHEMRNPIAIIMQGVTFLEQVTPGDALDSHETLTMIKDSAKRADGIVSSLLDFSRAAKLDLQPAQVRDILESSLALVKAGLKGIKVVKDIQEKMPDVLADKNKLMQVFINLFMNAAQAMGGAGTLTIKSYASSGLTGKRVIIEVQDTGTGISEENIKKIFDPFFTTKGPGKGTGLGLSITRNIVLLHKGQIEVKSRVNNGTTFTITLNAPQEERQ